MEGAEASGIAVQFSVAGARSLEVCAGGRKLTPRLAVRWTRWRRDNGSFSLFLNHFLSLSFLLPFVRHVDDKP
ncbi:hypothetical protein T439DRAFT_69470 [Meredithblackwellia eburnea MCA 4105]